MIDQPVTSGLIVTTANDKRMPPVEAIWSPLLELDESIELFRVERDQIKDLANILPLDTTNRYAWVLIDLPFKHLKPLRKYLARLNNGWIYEQDACQDFIRGNRLAGKFSALYRKIGNCRIVVNGYLNAERFRQQGLDVYCVPKGYDDRCIYYEKPWAERTVDYGFIGRTEASAYQARAAFLRQFDQGFGLQQFRTDNFDDYRMRLNSFRYFVSADIGFDEYMGKNFEAMACGCVLIARHQGLDDWMLGLQDMQNVLLYSDYLEAREKLVWLQQHPEQAERIAEAGRTLAERKFSLKNRAQQLLDLVTSTL